MSHSSNALGNPRGRRLAIVAGLVAVVGVVGAGLAMSGLMPASISAGGQGCVAARDVSAALAGTARGEVAAFQVHATPRSLPELRFNDPAGAPMTLANLKGKTVLLNLWATWCAPCRKEMPALDALQAEFGGPAFEVVAVNIDTRNLDKPRAWLEENQITRLAYYADPEARIFQDLKRVGQAVGMPTTLLIDAKGCQLGVLHGPAEWASDDAKRLISAALGR